MGMKLNPFIGNFDVDNKQNLTGYAPLASPTFTGTVVLPSGQVLIAPALGTPVSGVMTNVTGTASGLTAGNVTTNANLTGVVTSVGNATAIADTALSIAKTSGLQTALDLKAPLATPTFTTNITTPLIIGGTAVGSKITY